MNKTIQLISLCAIACLSPGAVIADHAPANIEVKSQKAQTKTISLKITGMT
jgi:hypothetical protein|tara:strand:+ start:89 stop:241 length:153 start_codon:yes stop_codon:yes gene_type:complete